MAEIASWNGHSFAVSSNLIRGFTGLTVKGSSETENKTSSSQKYVSRKNGNPSEIGLTAELNAYTGCDVKNEALKFVDEARNGAKDYFYMGGKKLIACQLMLTEASVSETTIAPNGTWISCKVKLTMKQCAKYDSTTSSSSSSSSSSSKKTSTKTSSTKKTTSKTTTAPKVSDAQAETARNNTQRKTAHVAEKVASTVSTAAKKIASVVSSVNNAKKTSSTTKKTSVVSKVVSGVSKVVKALTK